MKIRVMLTCGSLLVAAGLAHGAVAPEEAAKLGSSLTALGAEASGNADGTIPAWTGGLTEAPPEFKPGAHYVDPYGGDEPKFTITSANLSQYKDKLSAGQIAMFDRYSGWKMPVYETRRSAAHPQGFYAETKANATRVELVEGGNGFTGTTGGIAFPIPKSGIEAIWNHLTAYNGDTYATSWAQAAVTAGGDYNVVRFDYEYDFIYSNQQKKPEERDPERLLYFLQIVTDPPRLAGSILLVHDYKNQVKNERKAWTYNPGQRRVRLAPQVSYDNPGTASDALRTNDDFGMYNGATDRYDWKLLGKREMYVPYNAYEVALEVALPAYSYKQVLQPGHPNPDLLRYELHRVWVVEAKLKDGTSHIYKKRLFYIDEDSWKVLLTDKYDNRDQLWRFAELHTAQYYDVPFLGPSLEVHYDLQSRRYIAMNLQNQEDAGYRPINRSDGDFTPSALRDKGKR